MLPLLALLFCTSPPTVASAPVSHAMRETDAPRSSFEGTVILNPAAKKTHSFHRLNRYLLETADGRYELYSNGHEERVEPLAGKRVRVSGRLVETSVEGVTHRELWIDEIEPAS